MNEFTRNGRPWWVSCYVLWLVAYSGGTLYGDQPLRPLDDGETEQIQAGALMWSDRNYTVAEWPEMFAGHQVLWRSSIQTTHFEVLVPGYVVVFTPASGRLSQTSLLAEAGFERVDHEAFYPYEIREGQTGNRCIALQKKVAAGDTVEFGYYGFAVWSETELPVREGFEVAPLVTIPTLDISGEAERHSVVAVGTDQIYHGHADTLLMPDGRTIFCAWTYGHARHIGPLAKSEDGGVTWGGLIRVPDNWWDTANTPTIHRLVDPEGTPRLIVFADGLDWRREGKPPYPMHQAVSEDEGRSWTPMQANGIQGEVPPKSVKAFDDGERYVMWTDLPGKVIQAETFDGGLTWTNEREIFSVPDRWAQPAVVRSPDGGRLLMLMRENSRRYNSLYSISDDEGSNWSEPRELPASLTGDRHVVRYAPDGRLVVAIRDQAGQGQEWQSPTRGHFLAWVGTFEDIVEGREGQYRVKLLHSHAGGDCGYAGLEVLPDGTFVATTYIKYAPGPKKHSVISTRFRLEETDALLVSPVEAEESP